MISHRRLARHIVRLLKENPDNREAILRMLAAHLVATKQTKQAHLLMQDIADELFTVDKHLAADIYRAFPLTDEVRTSATNFLQQTTGARTVELHEHVDLSLLSGLVIRTSRWQWDSSAKRLLKLLKKGA